MYYLRHNEGDWFGFNYFILLSYCVANESKLRSFPDLVEGLVVRKEECSGFDEAASVRLTLLSPLFVKHA